MLLKYIVLKVLHLCRLVYLEVYLVLEGFILSFLFGSLHLGVPELTTLVSLDLEV